MDDKTRRTWKVKLVPGHELVDHLQGITNDGYRIYGLYFEGNGQYRVISYKDPERVSKLTGLPEVKR